MRNSFVGVAVLACVVIAGCGQDKKSAQEAMVVMAGATETDAHSIEEAYATAKGIALTIQDSEVRERVLADIQEDYQQKREKLVESDRIAEEAIALMRSEHMDIASLRKARQQAEDLARKMSTAEQTDTLLATIDSVFNQQEDNLARQQERVAQEQLRLQQLEQQIAEVSLAAEKKLQEERERAAEAERHAAEAQAASVPQSQPCMCCCSYIKSYWTSEPKRVYEWMGCDACTRMTKPWPDEPPVPYCADKNFCGR